MALSVAPSNFDMNDSWTLSAYSQMVLFQNDFSREYLAFDNPSHAKQQIIQSLAHRSELGLEYQYNLLERIALVSRPLALPQDLFEEPNWSQFLDFDSNTEPLIDGAHGLEPTKTPRRSPAELGSMSSSPIKRQAYGMNDAPPTFSSRPSDKESLALARLNSSYDNFLSYLGTFIGRLHLQSQSSADLISTLQRSVKASHDLLEVIGVICAHDKQNAEAMNVAQNAVYDNIDHIIDITQGVINLSRIEAQDAISLPKDNCLLKAATNCVKAVGECVAKAKFMIGRIGNFRLEPQVESLLTAAEYFDQHCGSTCADVQNDRLDLGNVSDSLQGAATTQSRSASRAVSVSSTHSNYGRGRIGKVFSRASSIRSGTSSMYSCFDSKSSKSGATDTSISSRRSRRAMDNFAKAAMKAVKAIGACWRCKLLRKHCDDENLCESCPTNTNKSEWKKLGCKRGTLEDNMISVSLCLKPLGSEIGSDDATLDNTLSDMNGFTIPFAVSTGNQYAISLTPLDDCIESINWELSCLDGRQKILGDFTVDRLTVLLRSAALYQARTDGDQLVAQSLICLRDCLEVTNLKMGRHFDGFFHLSCLMPGDASTCNIESIANLDASISRYVGEFSRVFFQKEKMRNVRTWWLSAFYSLCIQHFVRKALLQLHESASLVEGSKEKPAGAQQYLHLAVRLFLAYSRKYDPLIQKLQTDFGATMSQEDILFNNEIAVTRLAVGHVAWKSAVTYQLPYAFKRKKSRNPKSGIQKRLFLQGEGVNGPRRVNADRRPSELSMSVSDILIEVWKLDVNIREVVLTFDFSRNYELDVQGSRIFAIVLAGRRIEEWMIWMIWILCEVFNWGCTACRRLGLAQQLKLVDRISDFHAWFQMIAAQHALPSRLYEMVRRSSISLWAKNGIVKSVDLAREENEDIRQLTSFLDAGRKQTRAVRKSVPRQIKNTMLELLISCHSTYDPKMMSDMGTDFLAARVW
ncbi:uncharacterized protein PAC_10012 [Phialocephala subalpina]|uniref:Uncharacterized protein n=1 Tax=Phialocephala subalpina TaxID=576137 RepID=A0A1L7X541_9HELO|nr:uncharacterized protein PAC_10012 [Phialocephala subalpina]